MQLSGVSGLNFSPFSDTAVSNFFSYFTMPSPIPAASPLQLGTSKDFGVVNTVSTDFSDRRSEPIKVSSLVLSSSIF